MNPKHEPPSKGSSSINELERRIKELIGLFEGDIEAARAAGISISQLKRYKKGGSKFALVPIGLMADSQGKPMDWVWAGSNTDNNELEKKLLDDFETHLNTIELPPSREEIARNPELQRIQRELQGMRSTRARVMKALIFSDKAAARQLTSNRLRAIEKHKKMNEEWKEATEAAGVPSDAIVSEHIKTLMFKHQIDAEEITPLLAALNPRQNKE